MKYGSLTYNQDGVRLDVSFADGSTFGGFYRGDCIEVLMGTEWKPTIIEHSDDWYLVGLYRSGQIPMGLQVRVPDSREEIKSKEDEFPYYAEQTYNDSGYVCARILTADEAKKLGYKHNYKKMDRGYVIYVDGFTYKADAEEYVVDCQKMYEPRDNAAFSSPLDDEFEDEDEM